MEIYTFKELPKNPKKHGHWHRLKFYCREEMEFEQINGRKPSKEEQKVIFEKYFPLSNIGKSYTGVCPLCKEEAYFDRMPSKYTGKIWRQTIKSLIILILKPIASMMQILSTHELAYPSCCSKCNELIVICPVCKAYAGRVPVSPIDKSYATTANLLYKG